MSLSEDLAKSDFSSTFTEDNGDLPKVSRNFDNKIQLNTVDFTPDLVYKHLRRLNVKTSSGPDSLPALLFKNLARTFSSPL